MRQKVIFIIIASLLVGGLLGLGGYTFTYARGYSYLQDDSAACANCHVMNEQYNGWAKSSHSAFAGCNSCHTDQGLVGKFTSKAINGWNHSWVMTTGNFEDPIRIHDWNKEITNNACVNCHKDAFHNQNAMPDCTNCHADVGHE